MKSQPKRRSPAAKALRSPALRHRIVPSKRVYKRCRALVKQDI